MKTCEVCGNELKPRQKMFCSQKCTVAKLKVRADPEEQKNIMRSMFLMRAWR